MAPQPASEEAHVLFLGFNALAAFFTARPELAKILMLGVAEWSTLLWGGNTEE